MTIKKRRLLTLARRLRKVPKVQFYMGNWLNGRFCGKPKEELHPSCGSTACAFGWACTIHSFRRNGLRMIQKQRVFRKEWYGVPRFEGEWGFRAAEKFFGLSSDEAIFLFDPDYKDDLPLTTARRIEKFVATH